MSHYYGRRASKVGIGPAAVVIALVACVVYLVLAVINSIERAFKR